MGKQPGPGQAKQTLLAFHAAILRLQAEQGKAGEPIPLSDWEAAMCRVITEGGAILTRQSCADKTWFLERLNLIQKTGTGKGKVSVIVLPATVTAQPQEVPA